MFLIISFHAVQWLYLTAIKNKQKAPTKDQKMLQYFLCNEAFNTVQPFMQKLPLSQLKCSNYGFILHKEIGFLSEKILGNYILNSCEILNRIKSAV